MSHDPRAGAAAACDRLLALVARAAELEARARSGGELRVPLARYALALLRQRIRPALEADWPRLDPSHVAVFGGTNSGKSTLLNLLLGCPAAEMSFRARHTQHPEAYLPDAIADTAFLDRFPTRFVGYARYIDERPPRQSDRELAEQGYRPALAIQHLARFAPRPVEPIRDWAVYWDVPDFSTEEAQYYMSAVLDSAATADLVLMTVTGESYADHRGELLRELLLAAGTPLLVVANKLEPESARLLADIRAKVAFTSEGRCVLDDDEVLPLPHVRGEDDHARLAALREHPQAAALRDAVGRALEGARVTGDALSGAKRFLQERWPELIAPLAQEAAIATRWQARVDELGRRELVDRYRRDFLEHKDYEAFNDVVREFLKMLELPWIGEAVRWLADRIRSPLVWVASGLRNWLFAEPEAELTPEEKVVLAGYEQWRELLVAEAEGEAQRTGHSGWRDLVRKLADPAAVEAERAAVTAALAEHQEKMKGIVRERADDLFRHLADNPILMRGLQGLKFTVDVALTVSAAAWTMGGIDPWDIILTPLIPPTVSLIIEAGFQGYVEQQKQQLKQEQQAALAAVLDERLFAPMRAQFLALARPEDFAQAEEDLRIVCGARF